MTDSAGPGFDRLRSLFDAAVDLPASDRAAFLDRACPDDDALRRRVERMLASVSEADRLFDQPLVPSFDPGDVDGEAVVGGRVGVYKITRLIGYGGMGAVYEGARADDQFHQRVAIKLIKRGMDTDLAIRRFRHERQILANLGHKNIAGLLDGGVTDDGRPYFVLEYVEGVPITAYCAERRLGVSERLQLFRQVCSAVQHAHQNLVVHRDLKPGNILVAADGTVKLLDFGIAKLLGEDDGDGAPLTRGGVRALTPEYASPEMVRGLAITVAADVYSLGVVLYELVTGRRPFQIADLSLAGIEHIICETDPSRPSAVVTDALTRDAGLPPAPRLRRALRGELDHIVLMAIRKEPERRYPSVDALARDVRNHLERLPVAAERDWAGYRLGKFVRRHAVSVTLGVLMVAALVGGMITTRRQARLAVQEAARAEQINRFMVDMLGAADPAMEGKDVTVRQVLDQAAAKVDSQLVGQGFVQAGAHSTIGYTYLALGRYDEALREFRRTLALEEQLGGPIGSDVGVALNNIGNTLVSQGKWLEADSVLVRARAVFEQLGRIDSSYVVVLDNLGQTRQRLGMLDSAEAVLRHSIEVRRRVLGENNPDLAYSYNNLAIVLGNRQQWAAGESLHRKALAITEKSFGPRSVQTAGTLNALAGALDLAGRPVAAESAYSRALTIRRALLGTDHPDYLWTLYSYAGMLADLGRCPDAIKMSREVLTHRGGSLADTHPAVAGSLISLGQCLDRQGDHKAGGDALAEAVAIRTKLLPPGHWAIGSVQSAYGEHLTLVGRLPEAEQILLTAFDNLTKSRGPTHARTLDTARRLRELYTKWGKPELAAKYRS